MFGLGHFYSIKLHIYDVGDSIKVSNSVWVDGCWGWGLKVRFAGANRGKDGA